MGRKLYFKTMFPSHSSNHSKIKIVDRPTAERGRRPCLWAGGSVQAL